MSILDTLAQRLGKSQDDVRQFLTHAPNKYKVYKIPKRSYGYRLIAQPSRELKDYQRTFLDVYGAQLPVHECVMSYRKTMGIRDNAARHRQQPYILKMDLESFFNSITPALLWEAWKQILGDVPSADEQLWLEQLLFWNRSKKPGGRLMLSVGAPSSPWLSNFCLYGFDHALNSYCGRENIVYTRYADDLTFSTSHKNRLFNVPEQVNRLLQDQFQGRLRINHSKTFFSSRAHNRHVTGVTLTNEGNLSLGRQRKRYMKSLVHQYTTGGLDNHDVRHLKGLLAFAQHIEPSFMQSLHQKYTPAIMQQLLEN